MKTISSSVVPDASVDGDDFHYTESPCTVLPKYVVKLAVAASVIDPAILFANFNY